VEHHKKDILTTTQCCRAQIVEDVGYEATLLSKNPAHHELTMEDIILQKVQHVFQDSLRSTT
jgi:tRNA A-37 threonylcarbamoyl transferase component Bud32